MEEKTINQRLNDLENKLDLLISEKNFKNEITEPYFMGFYNDTEMRLNNAGIIPLTIWLNDKYAESLKHKVLYPDHAGYWYPIGKGSDDIPVAFRTLKNDYLIESVITGNFIK